MADALDDFCWSESECDSAVEASADVCDKSPASVRAEASADTDAQQGAGMSTEQALSDAEKRFCKNRLGFFFPEKVIELCELGCAHPEAIQKTGIAKSTTGILTHTTTAASFLGLQVNSYRTNLKDFGFKRQTGDVSEELNRMLDVQERWRNWVRYDHSAWGRDTTAIIQAMQDYAKSGPRRHAAMS
jgi:hypothetical protein